MSGSQNKTRRRTEEMFTIMELYKESGLNQKAFCKEMNIVPHVFNYWWTKYRKQNDFKRNTPKEIGFIPLEIQQSESSKAIKDRGFRITYPDGTLVEFSI